MLLISAFVLFWQASLLLATLIGAPTVYANKEAIGKALKLAGVKKYETVIDLGCGDGRSLFIAAEKYGAKAIGIERSLYCYFLVKLKIYIFKRKDIEIYFGDFSKKDQLIKEADVIYAYLLTSVMKEKEDWFFSNTKKNARIVSLAFPFTNHEAKKQTAASNLGKLTNIYMYTNH